MIVGLGETFHHFRGGMVITISVSNLSTVQFIVQNISDSTKAQFFYTPPVRLISRELPCGHASLALYHTLINGEMLRRIVKLSPLGHKVVK